MEWNWKKNSNRYQNFQNIVLNLIFIIAIKYQCSSITVKVIGRELKLDKQNRQQTLFTNGPFKTTSITSSRHDTFNNKIVKADQEPITTNTYSVPIKYN